MVPGQAVARSHWLALFSTSTHATPMRNENPMGKGPDGALGFLKLWGTFTIAPCLQLPGPVQLLKNRRGFWRWQDQAPTVGRHWDFNTHHNTRDNGKGRQKRSL